MILQKIVQIGFFRDAHGDVVDRRINPLPFTHLDLQHDKSLSTDGVVLLQYDALTPFVNLRKCPIPSDESYQ